MKIYFISYYLIKYDLWMWALQNYNIKEVKLKMSIKIKNLSETNED